MAATLEPVVSVSGSADAAMLARTPLARRAAQDAHDVLGLLVQEVAVAAHRHPTHATYGKTNITCYDMVPL